MTEKLMTQAELDDLRGEIDRLEGEGRRQIAERIKTAREWGDLKENAEYHAAKEEQAHLETRILRLRDRLQNASVVEEGAAAAAGVAGLGATVEFVDETSGASQRFRLTSAGQARPGDGTLSFDSPVGRALAGHRAGETVVVHTPRGDRRLCITSIS
ncbi:MAG TPA: transcription elongation factor GreA [Thermoleophilaceae bacterium]